MDDLVAFIVIDRMRDEQQNNTFDDTKRLPAHLAVLDPILRGQREGIGEGPDCELKADPVLAAIAKLYRRSM